MTVTDEQRAAKVAAIVEERRGVDARLAGAREQGDRETVATLEARLAHIDEQLAVWTGEAAPRARRAEKRAGARKPSARKPRARKQGGAKQ